MNTPLKIVFAGTPEFAACSLNALLSSQHHVVAAYTQPDRPAGRGRKLNESPVKRLALEHNIPVHQPKSLKTNEARETLASFKADVMIVVAYGLILPKDIIETPRLGCLNVHASLLPRWRGAAPIQRAILAGDTKTGVTIMQMDEGLDTGDMLLKETCDIGGNTTGGELHDELAELGAQLIVRTLDQLETGSIQAQKQDDSETTYAHKLSKQEAMVDWSQSATKIHNLIRAFNPWPVAMTAMNNQTCRIWQSQLEQSTTPKTIGSDIVPGTILKSDKNGIIVMTGEGQINITRLQLQGGKVLDIQALLNSKKALFEPGNRFEAVTDAEHGSS